MIVVEELASEFEIEFVSKLRNALLDVLRLDLEIFFVVEPVFHNRLITTGYKYNIFRYPCQQKPASFLIIPPFRFINHTQPQYFINNET